MPLAETPTADDWEFWIDRGGTFTDIVARRPDGLLLTHKLLSDNPEHYRDAAAAGIAWLMQQHADHGNRIGAVKMGTTVATNALLERRGEPTVLAITAGHADALRIGHQSRPRLFDRHIKLPSPLYAQVPSPEYGQFRTRTGGSPVGNVRKCTFCLHLQDGEGRYDKRAGRSPACAKTCTGHAIFFGDFNDPESDVSRLVRERQPIRLKEELGTEPNVHYLL